ncbi:MAG: hypothetical protein ACOC7U_07175 [Spirochaetota bacterium]
MIRRAEQLSGANYTEHKQLKEQLLLDAVNRWIYFDEDRNPNNYMLLYNSRNSEIVVAIDFLNVDLLCKEIKVKGTESRFGWERMEKTRYLTPLKSENFIDYTMDFFNQRFCWFNGLNENLLADICNAALRYNTDRSVMSRIIAANLKKRIEYVYNYFNTHLTYNPRRSKNRKYRDIGKTFSKLYADES